jgi:hypothetical protein
MVRRMIGKDAEAEGAESGDAAAPDALKKARERDKDAARGARLPASPREARLAEALRDNLRRRKEAARKDRT